MNVLFALALVAAASIALFWKGRSGYSLSETWPPGVGLIVHGLFVLAVAWALSGCTEPLPPSVVAWETQPVPSPQPQGHRQAFQPSPEVSYRP